MNRVLFQLKLANKDFELNVIKRLDTIFDVHEENPIENLVKLLDEGLDINQILRIPYRSTYTVLSLSFSRCSHECSKYLIEHGANINTPEIFNQLSFAIRCGDEKQLKLMLDMGVDSCHEYEPRHVYTFKTPRVNSLEYALLTYYEGFLHILHVSYDWNPPTTGSPHRNEKEWENPTSWYLEIIRMLVLHGGSFDPNRLPLDFPENVLELVGLLGMNYVLK